MEMELSSRVNLNLFDVCQGFLIPGLPNHIAILCLLKVSRLYHLSLRGVSSLWSRILRSPGFYEGRRRMGTADAWLVVLSTELVAATQLHYSAYDLQSRQLLFKVKLPPFSALGTRGIDYYRLAAINEYFVLLGWKRDCWWHPRNQFLIYNTVTNKWKHGAAIGVSRCLFACGVIHGNLYVAGGFNCQGRLERSMEVYNLIADEWKIVANIPDEVDNIEADVVFQDKLYVRCSGSGNQQTWMFWVYDPGSDAWRQDARLGMSLVAGGQLIATEKFIYTLSFQDVFHRFEASDGEGKVAGQAWEATNTSFNVHSQRAFGHGNDIFVLTGGNVRHSMVLSEDGCKCHELFLGASWYRAGAIVQA